MLFEGTNASLYWVYNQNSVRYVTPWKLTSLALMCLRFALANPASSVAPSPSEYLIQLWTWLRLTSQVQKGGAPFQSVFSFTFAEWKGNEGVVAIFTEVNVQRRWKRGEFEAVVPHGLVGVVVHHVTQVDEMFFC